MSNIECRQMCFRCFGFNTRWIFKPLCWKCNDCNYCTDGFDYSSEFDFSEDNEWENLESDAQSKSSIIGNDFEV